jgi:hypothetical protein
VSPAVILPMTRASLRLGVVRMGVRSILGTYSDMGAATFSVMTKVSPDELPSELCSSSLLYNEVCKLRTDSNRQQSNA